MLAALGSQAKPEDVLEGCWKFLARAARTGGWNPAATRGSACSTRWTTPGCGLDVTGPDDPIFECELCRRRSPLSVRGVCTTLGCAGKLTPARRAGDDDHYRYLYRQSQPGAAEGARAHRAADVG